MNAALKNQIAVVGTSTVVGFVGDVVMYSIAESKGKKFAIHFPKGKALFQVVALGFVTGLIIDYVVKQVTESVKVEEEKKLDKLVAEEKSMIYEGQIKGQNPERVIWV